MARRERKHTKMKDNKRQYKNKKKEKKENK